VKLHFWARPYYCEKRLVASCVCPPVCRTAWNISVPTGRIFMKLGIWGSFENVETVQVWLKSDKNNGYSTWRPRYVYGKARPFLRMRNVSDKSCREKTHVLCPVTLSSRNSCRLWGNTGKYGTARQATDNNIRVIWRMRVSCWIPKATDTHSEYVIVASPRQQWLHERACYVTRTLPVLCFWRNIQTLPDWT
jgi:hypothetical protein